MKKMLFTSHNVGYARSTRQFIPKIDSLLSFARHFLILPIVCLLFTACDDSSYERHQTIAPNMIGLYADQTQITFPVISLDSWTSNLTSEWLSMSPTLANVAQDKVDTTSVRLTAASTNTTGKTRVSTIGINANDYLSIPVYQYYWLNVSTPAAVYINNTDPNAALEDIKVVFPMSLKATAVDTAIVFTTYQSAVTLSSDVDWLTPALTEFTSGNHIARFAVTANSSSDSRTGNLRLTSGGVSTDIVVTQAGTR